MSAEKLYVMSGTYYQARRFAESKGVTGPTGLRWINRDEHIRGLRGIELHVLPSAYYISDFDYMMDLATAAEFKIIMVRDER